MGNSVAVLFMITLDDEIVSFSDYSQVTMSLGQAQVNRVCAACGVVGTVLLKLQVIWRIPYLCSLLVFPFVIHILTQIHAQSSVSLLKSEIHNCLQFVHKFLFL